MPTVTAKPHQRPHKRTYKNGEQPFYADEFKTPEQLGMFVKCGKCNEDVVFDGLLTHYYHYHKPVFHKAVKVGKSIEEKLNSYIRVIK